MPSRFRRSERVFTVDLQVNQLDHIPSIPRLFYLHWRAKKASPPEGRTVSHAVTPSNIIPFNTHIPFSITIPSHPSNPAILQPAPLVLQLRSERKGRWLSSASWQAEGRVTIDLAEVAAIGHVSRNFLVQDSLLNTTLNLVIRVTHQSGDRIFRTRQPEHDLDDSESTESGGGPASLAQLNALPSLSFGPGASATSAGLSGAVSAVSLALGGTEGDTGEVEMSPSVVLENSIPNLELVQSRVYETMFQGQIRDGWPPYIVESRVDPTMEVDRVYAVVCAQDGIGVGEELGSLGDEKMEKMMSVEALIESRNPVIGGGSASGIVVKKVGGRSPHMSVRSSSMGEIAQLTTLG